MKQEGNGTNSTTGNERVNHPRHYNSHPAGIECIDVVEHLPFNVGNAVKYLWRCDHKGADIEDLKKAAWYVGREIERREHERHRLAKEAIAEDMLNGKLSFPEAEVLFDLEERRERERKAKDQEGHGEGK